MEAREDYLDLESTAASIKQAFQLFESLSWKVHGRMGWMEPPGRGNAIRNAHKEEG